ncbi:MAG: PD40 domain-containing protein, partial [Deltaproteobacteria bacterium]|nr:PD40 domain-containing protein [Deltaproteobacteria bacterium]
MDGEAMTPLHHSSAHWKRRGAIFTAYCLFALALSWVLFSCAAPVSKTSDSVLAAPGHTDDTSFFGTETQRRVRPRKLPVHQPEQVTFEADPILYAAVSGDGRWLVHTAARRGFSELIVRSLKPGRMPAPKQLLREAGALSAPAISPDARWVAYVGAGYDVKGDIYLLEWGREDAQPRRLTGRDTEDGAPAFSADGGRLFFHQATPGKPGRRVVALDLTNLESGPTVLDTGGDGAFPALSPDGGKCAFVSFREDATGDIFVLELDSGAVTPLTRGPARDLFPVWSADGAYVYFTRFSLDTDGDGKVGVNDGGAVFRARADDPSGRAFPLTSSSYSSFNPLLAGSRLFFLSTRRGVGNLWSLPPEGEIPSKDTVKAQAALANDVALQVPPDPFLNMVALWRVLERFPDHEALAATSACAIGRLYDGLAMPGPAADAYSLASDTYKTVLPEAAFAEIHQVRIRAFVRGDAAITRADRARVLKDARARLDALLRSYPDDPDIWARAAIEEARILSRLGQGAEPLLNAIEKLTRVIEADDTHRRDKAEAAVLRADLFARVGRSSAVFSAYIKVVRQYPDMAFWADQAVERILELRVGGGDSPDLEDQARSLSRISLKYREDLPKLSMGAWNRLGDLHYANGDRAAAKKAYQQVMSQFETTNSQTAAARLALAEILYEEERFRQALDLYETEMTGRPFEDRVYRLARAGYVRKSLASAEFLFRLGEIPAAQSAFTRLIREDYGLVAAHRGYIKCAAARKQIPTALGHYIHELERRPDDPVTLYAVGLCMTYREGPEALDEAGGLIDRAISTQGQVAYYHQTRGYIWEVLETVHGRPGHLESALASYQKAYFLNDRAEDPENAAHLALNLGNIHFLLGQYARAFEYYLERYNSGVAFDREETEIVFFRRFGQCAFQVRDREQPILAFSRALELIDKRIDPKRCSVVMGKINRYVSDRLLTPALRQPRQEEKARLLVQRQSDLNGRVFETSARHVGPPPGAAWESYRNDMRANILEQEAIVGQLSPLVPEGDTESMPSLETMLVRATEALEFPKRMIQLKAEMLDRLGLAYQEEGRWARARSSFEQAFLLNRGLGRYPNLAVNRRSSAYCDYMQADETPGPRRHALLQSAIAGFRETIDLVGQYGVPSRDKGERGTAAISMTLDVALDEAGATSAAFGFSAEQEVRLAETFIARIQTELGVLQPARDLLNRQLAQYPPGLPIPERDLYGVSLLAHRAGHLAYAEGKPHDAFDRFQRSAELALKMKNPVSAAINVANMGAAAMAMPGGDERIP